ncbi:hypothetical protein [Azospirillum doebereinerae]
MGQKLYIVVSTIGNDLGVKSFHLVFITFQSLEENPVMLDQETGDAVSRVVFDAF